MGRTHGPTLTFSDRLHAEKYRLPHEDFREACNRVASALKDDDQHFRSFRDALLDMRFMPAGRIQAAMGAPKAVTPYNCYVSGTIEDSFVDGEGSIMQRAAEAAQTMRMGGGIGYDFSGLRPRGELIKKLQSRSSGPVSFMEIYDAICRCVASSGHRRGAQMGVLRIDHPDVEEFILAKQNVSRLTGFNISLGVTDEFMECLAAGRPFPLKWGGRTYKEVDPAALWEMVMRGTWDWAEPGVLFIDTINRKNNLWYCEDIAATNPCGEQPLPPFGACLLGSFNLARYVTRPGIGYAFDWDRFRADIPPVVRAMDNVVDRALYPLPQQRMEALAKRRMGLGITGLANAAEALGFPYASPEFMDFQLRVLDELRDGTYLASADLAREKGPFPKYDRDLFLAGEFAKTLPDHVRHAIHKHGLRNSHLTSIAPTGTISFCADYVSSGIEPVFEYEGKRLVNMPEGQVTVDVSDYGFREFGVKGRLAHTVSAQEHVDVLAAASALVDSAVSKTCNVDGSMDWEDFKGLYVQAWERECKGCTTFNKDGKRMGILLGKEDPAEVETAVAKEPEPEQAAACFIDPSTGLKECG
ncbi:adenosylcobalamin-dependent ribonucleoside-diphosphate reductase [Brucella abortus]|uniref:adenosylcobalamin-dependent ribonucleoside-diphosphate reductase n=1 Tax=Brucella abortus TaxID=235 RepID=UPI0005C7B0B2|nr:adenosylcobalamin-dependent ribonucleoside-diphosphate reductase [Brucella abortus]RUQ67319.1 adenosylcobalamin-dependent ribonucleoside-diphosphate reductase [Brucella abortus]RUQ78550.1 adenosylcobalamin-dependent ribonucleoside-diphosphate reductase [Brucella abortus]RUQ88292.1 adenosylcobalamin-dependent ribonucleoside-diphosphate reductase [Brucella abortus]RUQ90322.1 adenosylcobalamin-dependent ribonucleoside-diphosphate reductase [Brucella abortus]RUR06667.1 adenosylcobalamin-depende